MLRFMKGKDIGRPLLALADVVVVVSDAKASAEWWSKNLGFATYTVGGGRHAILVAPPGERFVLHLCEGFAPLEPGNTGIAFLTDDMDALVARMTQRAVQFPEPPQRGAGPKMAKFADPDGNIFWLVEVPASMVRATLNSRAPNRKRAPVKPRARRRKR